MPIPPLPTEAWCLLRALGLLHYNEDAAVCASKKRSKSSNEVTLRHTFYS